MAALAIVAAFHLSGCWDSTPPPTPPDVKAMLSKRRPVTYTVVAGESAYQIARRYKISTEKLMDANGLNSPWDLHVGQVLVIPGAYQTASLGGVGASGAHPYRGERSSRQFLWPVSHGVVSSGFGVRNGAMHDGVDISAPVGTPVYAADSGTVIFCGKLHGYGNTVIVRHDDNYATVYGHQERNLTTEGAHVRRGQEIGEIGRTGRTTGANLHFEVRCDNLAKDPLAYLPEPTPTSGITFADAGVP